VVMERGQDVGASLTVVNAFDYNLTCTFDRADTRKMNQTVFDESKAGKRTIEGSEADNSTNSAIFNHTYG